MSPHRTSFGDNLLWIITFSMLLREAQGMNILVSRAACDRPLPWPERPAVCRRAQWPQQWRGPGPHWPCWSSDWGPGQVRAQWGRSAARRHCWPPASVAPAHSGCLAGIPALPLLLLSALQCSNLPVPRLPLCVRDQDGEGYGKTCPSEGHSLQDGYGRNEMRGERGCIGNSLQCNLWRGEPGGGGRTSVKLLAT